MLRYMKWMVVGWVLAGVMSAAVGQARNPYYPSTPFVAWSPNGQYLAVGDGPRINIIDAETLVVLNNLYNLEVQKASAAWSSDGTRLAVINGPDVEIWDFAWDPALAVKSISYAYYDNDTPPYPREEAISVKAVVWSPDGTQIALVRSGRIDIVSAATGVQLQQLHGEWGEVPDLDWSIDGRLVLASQDPLVYVIDPLTGGVLNYFYTIDFASWSSQTRSVAFSPDGHQLAVGTDNGFIAIWTDVETAPIDNDTPALVLGNLSDQRHSRGVDTLDWSPTGQYLVSGSQDGTIRLWDAQTGELLQVIDLGENAWVFSLAWSSDGSRLAYGNAEGGVSFFDATQLPGYMPMAGATAESGE